MYLLALQYLSSGAQVRKFESIQARYVRRTSVNTAHHIYMYLGIPITMLRKKTNSENFLVQHTQICVARMGGGGIVKIPAQSVDQNNSICLGTDQHN
jgi:hypothetical protein